MKSQEHYFLFLTLLVSFFKMRKNCYGDFRLSIDACKQQLFSKNCGMLDCAKSGFYFIMKNFFKCLEIRLALIVNVCHVEVIYESDSL